MKNQTTIDGLIKQLQQMKKGLGGKTKVNIRVPYEGGIGWRYEFVAADLVSCDGECDIPITLNYGNQKEWERQKTWNNFR